MPHFTAPNMKGVTVSSLPETGALIALDYGKARIGIALSSPEQTEVFAHKVLTRTKKLQGTLEAIGAVVKEWQVVGIVVGLPLNADGTQGPLAQAARAFASSLKKHLALPLALQDERYTSLDALNDAEAAKTILERFFALK